MNPDIVDYLEGYWEKIPYYGVEGSCYQSTSEKGTLTYFSKENELLINWSPDSLDGYTTQIQDLQHLIQLEALL